MARRLAGAPGRPAPGATKAATQARVAAPRRSRPAARPARRLRTVGNRARPSTAATGTASKASASTSAATRPKSAKRLSKAGRTLAAPSPAHRSRPATSRATSPPIAVNRARRSTRATTFARTVSASIKAATTLPSARRRFRIRITTAAWLRLARRWRPACRPAPLRRIAPRRALRTTQTTGPARAAAARISAATPRRSARSHS